MHGDAQYPPAYATVDAMQDFNPRDTSDFNPRALSPHFLPADPAPFKPTHTNLFPAPAHFADQAPEECKAYVTSCNRGGFDGMVESELSRVKNDVQSAAVKKSMSPTSQAETQYASSPTSFGFGAGTAVPEQATFTKNQFVPSDPRFGSETHFLRGFYPVIDRNNPYIDPVKAPSWQQIQAGMAPPGAGYSFPKEDWSAHAAAVGRCPSFGALPNYHRHVHHHGCEAELSSVLQAPTFHASPFVQSRARNSPEFMRDPLPQQQPASSIDYHARGVGLFRAVDGYTTDEAAAASFRGGIWTAAPMDDPWGSDQRQVWKSQSMRALYEENEALRRALYSMRRGADQDQFQAAAKNHHLWAQQGGTEVYEQDEGRYISNDTAEGRTVSMRERGRWGIQEKAAGCKFPIWVGEEEEGGRKVGGGAGQDGRLTLKEQMQLLARQGISGGAATTAAEVTAWRARRGRRPAKHGGDVAGSGENGSCAMCGGKLRRTDVAAAVAGSPPCTTKKSGLPLRLCTACHPSAAAAAASLPISSGAPPLRHLPSANAASSARAARHPTASVATVISMACKPNTTAAAPTSARKKSKARFVDLCRHLVGLAMKE